MRRRQRVIAVSHGDVPSSLALGPCIEVWEGLCVGSEGRPMYQAFHRWTDARGAWFQRSGLSGRKAFELIPGRAPWSVEFLIYRGHAERIGRPVTDLVDEWFARVGCTVRDIPALRREAQGLVDLIRPDQLTINRRYADA